MKQTVKTTIAAVIALLSGTFVSFAQKSTLEQLMGDLADPPVEYRSAPLWVWNTAVTRGEIDRMLAELKNAGFGGAYVHPRPGLLTEYLSDEWFDLFKYSVEVGKNLGLEIWIYDENSYPSGFAGGHVPAEMPESYNQGQGLTSEKTAVIPDDTGEVACILKKEGNGFTDITAEADKYRGVEGEYYLYKKTRYGKSSWHGGFSYVDLLYPGVTEKFIEITMSGYEKALGSDLGPVVKGIFTDEPEINTSGGIRWTPDLFEVFRDRWGYELTTSLPSLFEETGDWRRVRHNYAETLLQLFVDRWAKPWFEYTESRGLLWTGHYWEHMWPDMSHGGDNMAMYVWHRMPAIDMLFNQFNERDPQAQFGNVRAVRELASVANQMGYKRTLSETYGGAGWETTFEDLKRLGDWEYALGVNFMNQHLAHMTLEGSRKYDYPPVFTYHSPWWEQYRYLNDYYGRLSMMLSGGRQINDILVLEPTSTIWMYYSYAGSNGKLWTAGRDFQNFVTRLEKSRIEYDLGSENIIKDHGSVTGAKLTIGQRSYGRVILPPYTDNLNSPTFDLLKKFVAGGGKLTIFSIPTHRDGKRDDRVKDFFRSNENIEYFSEPDDDVIASLAGGECVFTNLKGGGLYHHRRSYDDGELIFLANSSLEENASGTISVSGAGALELDAFTAGVYSYPSIRSGEVTSVEYDLAPAGSLVLFFPDAPLKAPAREPGTEKNRVLESSTPVSVKPLKDNVLFLDFSDLTVNGDEYRGVHFADAAYKYFNHAGFPGGDPWTTSIQYRQQLVERDTIRTGSASVRYRFNIGEGVDTRDMRLITEKPELWTVKVNGRRLTPIPGEWWLDVHFGVYSIEDAVRRGENVVEMSVAPLSIFAEIEPVYILGNFDVVPAQPGWTIEKASASRTLGSWKEQGMPFYSWDVAYSKNYRITDKTARYAVTLTTPGGTVAQVNVNGEKAGIIAFRPYELDITKLLKRGDNTIEVVVTGSLKNLLGPHHNDPGKGLVTPWHWKNIVGPVEGAKYQLLDYGLSDDFQIVSSK